MSIAERNILQQRKKCFGFGTNWRFQCINETLTLLESATHAMADNHFIGRRDAAAKRNGNARPGRDREGNGRRSRSRFWERNRRAGRVFGAGIATLSECGPDRIGGWEHFRMDRQKAQKYTASHAGWCAAARWDHLQVPSGIKARFSQVPAGRLAAVFSGISATRKAFCAGCTGSFWSLTHIRGGL